MTLPLTTLGPSPSGCKVVKLPLTALGTSLSRVRVVTLSLITLRPSPSRGRVIMPSLSSLGPISIWGQTGDLISNHSWYYEFLVNHILLDRTSGKKDIQEG